MTYNVSSGTLNPTIPYHTLASGRYGSCCREQFLVISDSFCASFIANVWHAGYWLLAKVVGEEHFGGFLTKVDSSTSDEKKKTWKEKMEEIISKSKKAKVSHLELFFNFHTYNCNLDNIFIAVHTVLTGLIFVLSCADLAHIM